MLDSLKYEDYAGQINTRFQIVDSNFEVELVEVSEKKVTPHQEMFALTFRGGNERFLEQRLYHLKHEILGTGELFLVPIGRDSSGYTYEAVFNRFVEN